MYSETQSAGQRFPNRDHGSGIDERACLVGIAQRLDQAAWRELQKTQQCGDGVRRADRDWRSIVGMVENDWGVTVCAGQRDLRPWLLLVAGLLGCRQHRSLHKGILGM